MERHSSTVLDDNRPSLSPLVATGTRYTRLSTQILQFNFLSHAETILSWVPAQQLNLRIIGNMGLILLAALGKDFTAQATHRWNEFLWQSILAKIVTMQPTHMGSKLSLLSDTYLRKKRWDSPIKKQFWIFVGWLKVISLPDPWWWLANGRSTKNSVHISTN